MKVPRVNRLLVTPQSLVERWPKTNTPTEMNVLDGARLFGNHQPETLAMDLLGHCAKKGGWAHFRADELADTHGAWLQRFVRAGLLVEAGGTYLVTDLLIYWFSDHLRPATDRELKQSTVRAVLNALDLGILYHPCMCVNYLYDGTLYTVRAQFNPD